MSKMEIQDSITMNEVQNLAYPLSACLIRDDTIAVANTGSCELLIWSFTNGRSEQVGGCPRLKKPSAVCTNETDRLYLLDETIIHKFNITGSRINFSNSFGSNQLRNRNDSRQTALGLTFNHDKKQVYTTFYDANQTRRYICSYTEEGEFIAKTQFKTLDSRFQRPCWITSRPGTEEIIASEMKKGQLHLASVKSGGSKILSERSHSGLDRKSKETNVSVWGKQVTKKLCLVLKISAL
jgi:hypothetical protein